MKILITTPNGVIGKRIVQELLAPEFSVRVITRDPEHLPAAWRAEVEVVPGSSDDPAVLRQALAGVEALFWCGPRRPEGESDQWDYYGRFARAASQAVRAAGTPRVVAISPDVDIGPGLSLVEQILNESGAAIRHLRCGWLMENLLPQARALAAQGLLSYPLPGDVAVPLVAASDVADIALRWLARRDWDGIAATTVHGPKKLTFHEVAAILAEVLGQPVGYQEESALRPARAGAEVAGEAGLTQSTMMTTLNGWAADELRALVTAGRGRAVCD